MASPALMTTIRNRFYNRINQDIRMPCLLSFEYVNTVGSTIARNFFAKYARNGCFIVTFKRPQVINFHVFKSWNLMKLLQIPTSFQRNIKRIPWQLNSNLNLTLVKMRSYIAVSLFICCFTAINSSFGKIFWFSKKTDLLTSIQKIICLYPTSL